MNDTKSSHQLAADLQRLTADLQQAEQDLEFYNRLKAAAMQVKNLPGQITALKAELADARSREANAAYEARMARFIDISVTETEGLGSLLHAIFTVYVTRWGSDPRTLELTQITSKGCSLDQLTPDVMEYLLTKCPERIPAAILALADNPADAINEYVRAKKRGYCIGRQPSGGEAGGAI